MEPAKIWLAPKREQLLQCNTCSVHCCESNQTTSVQRCRPNNGPLPKAGGPSTLLTRLRVLPEIKLSSLEPWKNPRWMSEGGWNFSEEYIALLLMQNIQQCCNFSAGVLHAAGKPVSELQTKSNGAFVPNLNTPQSKCKTELIGDCRTNTTRY